MNAKALDEQVMIRRRDIDLPMVNFLAIDSIPNCE